MGVFDWWINNNVTNRICPQSPCLQGDPEGGIDKYVKPGTPITALVPGTIVGMGPCVKKGGGSCGGYVITTRTNQIPGLPGSNDLYYQHLQSLAGGLSTGQSVHAGQTIGFSGGNTEVGINPAGWFGVWGPSPHPGPWIQKPEGYLNAAAGIPGASGSLPGTQPWQGEPIPGSCTAPTSALDVAGIINFGMCMWWQQAGSAISGWGIKIGLFMVALILVVFGGYILFQRQIDTGAKTAVKGALLA